MPRRCSVCSHPNRDQIDRAVVAGQPMRRIAAEHGISESGLRRHVRQHVRPAIAAAAASPDTTGPLEGSPEISIASFFRARRIAELTTAATLRQHVVMDVQRLEILLRAAIDASNGPAILAIMRTKWAVLDRSGLTDRPDAPLDGRECERSDGPEARAARLAEDVAHFFRRHPPAPAVARAADG